jgi:2-succinyl-6-hydroxy-2,4-cyclohexadiene-1-carboxylate synthase
MGLHVERVGSGPPVVLVHGFTQTGRSWGELATALGAHHEVLLPDAPGHGGSAEVRADLPTGADLLVEACGTAAYVGYSMGARLCLHAALAHPEAVQALVVIGGTGGLDDPADRAARVAQDRATSARIAEEGLEAFLEGWMAQPMFEGVPRDRAGVEDRRRNTIAGLRSSLELAGTGAQEPLWDRLGSLSMPVLVVAGAADAKFTALGHRLVDSIGANATFAAIAGAGHAAHLEQPDAFLALLGPWLADASGETAS